MPITIVSAEPIEGVIRREVAIVSALAEHKVGQYVLVRLADEEGRIGLGEASVTAVWSGETQAGAVALIREVLAPLVVGADPFDSEWITRRLDRAAFGNSFARAALETALLDLQGRILNIPLYKLLGGRERPAGEDRGVRLKFVVGAVEPDRAGQLARQMVQGGWRAIHSLSNGSAPTTSGASTSRMTAMAPACVSPLQTQVTLASPNPTRPASSATRTSM